MSLASETARYLGLSEGKNVHRYATLEQVASKNIPFLHVRRDGNRFIVRGGGHEGHDNEPRMDAVCHVLQTRVLPRVPVERCVDGYYSIELHDSYSYLARDHREYTGAMSFSKDRRHADVACIPDLYQLCGYDDKLHARDPFVDFESKLDAIVGAYTTTGDRDPTKNTRVQTCLWSLDHRSACHLYVTKVAQMCPRRLFETYPRLRSIARDFVSPTEQRRYKFLLNLPGNTETWDMPWMLRSRSMVIKRRHPDMCWYTPLLLDRTHVVLVDDDDHVLSEMQRYVNDPREAVRIVDNANGFVDDFLSSPTISYDYWAAMFETCKAIRD